MTTSPSADIPRAILSQTFSSVMALLQLIVPRVIKALQERLARRESLEAILDEWVRSAGETPADKGLAHLLSAVHYFGRGQNETALAECSEARQAWPNGSSVIQFFEAHLLTSLRRYDEASLTFGASYQGLWPILKSLQEIPDSTQYVEQLKQDFYKRWALPGVLQGLEGLLPINYSSLVAGGEKVVVVLRHARVDGQEGAVWSAIAEVEQSLPPELQRQMQEFRTFVELIAIEDPFERIRVLRKRISAVWPKDVDCVDAVREQRR